VSGVRFDRPGIDEVDKHEYLLKAYAVTDYVARRQSREELAGSSRSFQRSRNGFLFGSEYADDL